MTVTFKQRLERYPSVLALFFLCAGILVANVGYGPVGSWSLVALIPGLGILLTTSRKRARSLLWLAVAVLFFLLGVHLAGKELLFGNDFHPPLEKQVIHATVSKMWSSGPGFRVLLLDSGIDATSGDFLPGLGRLFLRDDPVALCAGDRIAFRSRIRKPINRGNPGEYDWEIDCKHNGIGWLASVQGRDSVLLLRRGSRFHPGAIIFQTREAMAKFLENYSGKYLEAWFKGFIKPESVAHVRGVLKGIILGDMGEIDDALNRSFNASGLAHMLSASGVHVGIVVLLSLFLVKLTIRCAPSILLWIPLRKVGAFVSIPAMVTYCLLVGARVPAIRATIMGLVVASAILLNKKWSSSNSLALAALIILLLYPLSLFTPSFQLSFAAVAGIFFVVPHLYRRVYGRSPEEPENVEFEAQKAEATRIKIKAWHALRPVTLVTLISLAATLAITPIIVQTFHSFPVYTLFANLVTDFLMTLALSVGLLAAIIGTLLPNFASYVLAPADFLTWFIVEVSLFFSNLPYSTIRIPHLSFGEFVASIGMAICGLWALRAPSRKTLQALVLSAALSAVVFMSSSWLTSQEKNLKVVFLNVGKGDAAFVQPWGTKGLLIDGGLKNEYFDAGKSIIIPFLDWHGARSLAGMLISHPQMDHIGGLLSVMGRIPTSRLWWNPIGPAPLHLDDILASAYANRVAVLPADRSQVPIQLGNAKLSFLNQTCPQTGQNHSHRDVNNASVVCRLDCDEVSFLFTGDLEREGEEELIAAGLPLAASVLKVAHHGGRSATSLRFLEAVRPKVAVISAEYPAAGGLPNPEVLARLESVGAEIFWTGRDGSVIIETDGKHLHITTGRKFVRHPVARSR